MIQNEGGVSKIVIRSAEMRIRHPKTLAHAKCNIPYGAHLFVENGQQIEKGGLICEWDPYNAVILSEVSGKIILKMLLKILLTAKSLTNKQDSMIK